MGNDYGINLNSSVYYPGTYWDRHPVVRGHINRTISGDPAVGWGEHFRRKAGRTFRHALVLNCGNGWVERDLVDAGIIEAATGIDCGPELLAQARDAAGDRPLTYVEMDTNTADFPDVEFDLVVNVDAAHHVARIDRVFHELASRLPDDGWFVSYDYIGPHRIQYELDGWIRSWAANKELPEHLRQDMVYPHLPTILATDPTESIHSELLFDTFARYFTVAEFVRVGGAIAYPLLTHNEAILDAPEAESSPHVERLLALDAEYVATYPDRTLFAYFAGQPRKDVLADPAQLAEWSAEEDAREEAAIARGGEYYDRTWLQEITIELSDRGIAAQHARSWAEDLLADNQLFARGARTHPRRGGGQRSGNSRRRGRPAPTGSRSRS